LIQIVAWVAGFALLGAVLGLVYQVLGTRWDRKLHPRPGKLVDIGTHNLHLLESGRGGPIVVLEAGLMSTMLSWSELHRALAASFRVVSYDRAGLGWSDLGVSKRSCRKKEVKMWKYMKEKVLRAGKD